MIQNKKLIYGILLVIVAIVIITGWVVFLGWHVANDLISSEGEGQRTGILDLSPKVPLSGTTENWKTYRNEEYGFEFKYPGDLILDDYDEFYESVKCNGCKRRVMVLKNKEENYNIYLSAYTGDKYDLCKEKLYNERSLNEIGRGEYKVIKIKEKLFFFDRDIDLENIFKDGQLQSIQSECQKKDDLVIGVHLSASDLDNFVLENPEKVIQEANQILSTFKFIEKSDTQAGTSSQYLSKTGAALDLLREFKKGEIESAPEEARGILEKDTVSVSIRFSHKLNALEIQQIESLEVKFVRINGEVTHSGDIYGANIPWDKIDKLVGLESVVRIESTWQLGVKEP